MAEQIIVEKFGDFLNKVAGFLTGIKSEAPSKPTTTFSTGRVQGGSDPVADSYSAEALKSALLSTYSKLDSILEAVKRMRGKDEMESAKSDVSGIVSFIQQAYKDVVEIIEDPRNIPPAERNRTLTNISKKLNQYILSGGEIDKWKEKWLGKYNSKLGGFEFFQKGKQLVAKGQEILAEVQRAKDLKQEVKQGEIQNVFKRAKESLTGKPEEEKPQKPGKKEDKKTPIKKSTPTKFSKKDPESIKLLRSRLGKIGITKTGTGKDFDDNDMPAVEKGMKYLGTVSGKEYGNTDTDIQEFFKDLGIFIKNRPKVTK